MNTNLVIDPGETKTVTVEADQPGVFPHYCTSFCSALHQEMQGYLVVKPRR
jgi:nitrous-oxide reductase